MVTMIPPELCGDASPVLPVLQRALEEIEQISSPFSEFAYLRATSPLVEPRQLAMAVQRFRERAQENPNSIDSVLGVVEVTGAHPSRFLRKDPETGILVSAFPGSSRDEEGESVAARAGRPGASSSSLTALQRSGGVCVTTPESIRRGSVWGQRALPLIMSEETAVDVNSNVDAILAEALLQRRRMDEEKRRAREGQCSLGRVQSERAIFP